MSLPPDFAEPGDAVAIGQAAIDNQHIMDLRGDRLARHDQAGGMVATETAPAKPRHEEVGETTIIFHQQETHAQLHPWPGGRDQLLCDFAPRTPANGQANSPLIFSMFPAMTRSSETETSK
jgi:hypothetical protein